MKIIAEKDKICIYPENYQEAKLLELKSKNIDIKVFYSKIQENVLENGETTILNYIEL